ncbi:LCCL domain-containing protein [Microdochium nivale]|nr:LCCL domain-containing protein [Microdochium nivale]
MSKATNTRDEVRPLPSGTANSSSSPLNRPDVASLRTTEVDETDDSERLPQYAQAQGGQQYSRRWRWVPQPVRTAGTKAATWLRGPPEPKDWKITPLLPAVQHAPIKLLDRFVPRHKHRVWLFTALCAAWILTFSLVMWSGKKAADIPFWGQPQDISCGTIYWTRNNDCGLDGMSCRPFESSGFPFRCPANCASYRTLNPRAVGGQEVVYAPLVIGGPSASNATAVYRGDSFICGAAIHAGIISNAQGGCGVVSKIGAGSGFAASVANGISSIGFDSYFPMTYVFTAAECNSYDPRWALLAVSVTFTTILGLFTTSSAAFFFATFIIAFWQVGLASDAPSAGNTLSLFTDILGKFVPVMFCAWVFYDKMCVRRTLDGLTAQIEKVVLWLGGLWVGALTNYTFDFIPLQRLTGHDLEQQPGAKAALAIIVIVIFCAMCSQIWFFRQEGRLVQYLKLYALFILTIVVCLLLPDLNLRIHHYILALLLLPGTSMQTRPSLLYQGILLGLFINGVARWGFDPFLQTSFSLQGDAQLGSALPVLLPPSINANQSRIEFTWQAPPDPSIDGISILVNDVERFRGYFDDPGSSSFVWTRRNVSDDDAAVGSGSGSGGSISLANYAGHAGFNEYFRFGWMQGTSDFDYTKAGTWDAEMNWVPMASGPSKIKPRGLGPDGTKV